ncbi:AAA family ATPase [Algoriphagus pacificus]|uniref:AAA family ATPase n=1 Tax=Algoriphagus pacificus TaxID=2811234 RepID=A0ABS3CJ53_9BACT|nr:AAA family ATPase [Algoriphagus pacificus]MBN7816795.1 AAA family ATPase [Algoriphagus pacificus]
MELRLSNRSQARIRIGVQGTSGSGKTYSSLLLAFGLCKDWKKIAVIDSENQSADLYSHLGEYNVITLKPPYTPERYIEAIDLSQKSSMDVIIIDSLSHEWEGEGGILESHAQMAGNSFTNWSKITPRHNALIQKILNSPAHVIATIRSKQDYIITDKNGKSVPEKVGMKGIQRDGLEYDFTIMLELDIYHNAKVSKDRTQLFNINAPFKINQDTGELIAKWCVEGAATKASIVEEKIKNCLVLEDLYKLYKETEGADKWIAEFNSRANQLRLNVNQTNGIPHLGSIISNGVK